MSLRTKSFGDPKPGFDDATMSVTAWFSAPTVDSENDLVDGDAFDLSNHKKFPVCHFMHKRGVPVGKFEDDNGNYTLKSKPYPDGGNGLHGTVYFAPTKEGEDLYRLYKGGFLKGFSVSFKPADERREKYGSRTINRIGKAELVEVSSVDIPMNHESIVTKMYANGEELPDWIVKSFEESGVLAQRRQKSSNDSVQDDSDVTADEIKQAIAESFAGLNFAEHPSIKAVADAQAAQATAIAEVKATVDELVKFQADAVPLLKEVEPLKAATGEATADIQTLSTALVDVSQGKELAIETAGAA